MDSLPPGTPGIGDLIAWVVTWTVAQLLKKYANGTTWAVNVRRFLPLFALGVGVGIQMLLFAVMGGEDWKQAIVRGLYTGGAAVMGHNLYKATALGVVRAPALPEPPQIDPPSDDGEEGEPC